MLINLDEHRVTYGESVEFSPSECFKDKRSKTTNYTLNLKLQRPKLQKEKEGKSSLLKETMPTSPKRSPTRNPTSPLKTYLNNKNKLAHPNSPSNEKIKQFQQDRKNSLLNLKDMKVLNTKSTSTTMNQTKKTHKDKHHHQVITQQNKDPKFFIEESKKLLKKGSYRKAFSVLEIFFKYHKNFSIEAHIKLNRMITIAINKICRHKYFNKFYTTDHEKISEYLDQCTISFKTWFKFLSIYIFINQQTHFNLLDLNKQMNTFILSVGEQKEKKDKMKSNNFEDVAFPLFKHIPKGFELDNGLDQTPKVLISKNSMPFGLDKSDRGRFMFSESLNFEAKEKDEDLNNSQYLDLFRNVNENPGNLLNLNYESTEFIKCLLDSMLNFSIFYIASNNYEVAYKYAYQLNQMSYNFDESTEVDLLRVLCKVKLHYVTFLFHFDLHKHAMIILEETLKISQKELSIRINLKITGNKGEKKKIRQKYFSCVRMMIIIIMTLGTGYKRIGKIDKFVELTNIADSIAKRFLSKADNLRTTMSKFCNTELIKFKEYLADMAELEYITKEMLKADYEFQMKLEQKVAPLNPISEADEYLYKKFDYKNFNNSNYVFIRPATEKTDEFAADFAAFAKNKPSYLQTKSTHPNEKFLIDKNTMNVKAVRKSQKNPNKLSFTEDTNTKADLSFTSFMNESSNSSLDCSTLLNDSPLLSVHSLRMQKLKNKRKKLRFFNKKEFPKGYNPKLLTTGAYFEDYKQNKKEPSQEIAKILVTDFDNTADKRKTTDHVSSYFLPNSLTVTGSQKSDPQNTFKRNSKTVNINATSPSSLTMTEANAKKIHESIKERDLDYYMNKKINENLEKKYHSERFQKINQNFMEHLKKEEFDKKEFSYCRKMLLMKRQENLKEQAATDLEEINNLKITKLVKTEAEDISNKLDLQTIISLNEDKLKTKQTQNTEMEENEEPNKKSNLFVDLILKHRKELNLNVVAEQILEMRKENEKKEKKKQEKKKSILKLQDQTCKASYFGHESTVKSSSKIKESPKTVPHFLNNTNKNAFKMSLSRCDTVVNKSKRNSKNIENLGPYRFSIELQRFMEKNDNISVANTNINTMNSIEFIPDPQKFTSLANNMIKVLTEDLQKEMVNNNKQIKNKNYQKNSATTERNLRKKFNDLAKSSTYLSLKKETQQKIFSFEDLLTLKTKLHYQGTKSFFGTKIMSHIFKKQKIGEK